jgi:hydrogenase maturation protein HypF
MALPGRPDIKRLLAAGIQTPSSTGAGRWFDAIAALLGVRDAISYEAQAACELEAIADRDDDAAYLVEMTDGVPFEIDLRPTIRAIENDLAGGTPTSVIASRFHSTMAEAIASACAIARARTGLEVVALSGGCFQNVLLTERVVRRLSAGGFRPLLHRLVPPNDGGLALGQAAVAVHCLSRTKGGS